MGPTLVGVLRDELDQLLRRGLGGDELALLLEVEEDPPSGLVHLGGLADLLLHVGIQRTGSEVEGLDMSAFKFLGQGAVVHVSGGLPCAIDRPGGEGLQGAEGGDVDDLHGGIRWKGLGELDGFRGEEAGGGEVDVEGGLHAVGVMSSHGREVAEGAVVVDEDHLREVDVLGTREEQAGEARQTVHIRQVSRETLHHGGMLIASSYSLDLGGEAGELSNGGGGGGEPHVNVGSKSLRQGES